jgi:LacI family transcriptional regulator
VTKTNQATIRDVASRAGVSVATVSRVLNGKGSVDPTLRERVLAAAEALEFRANRLALSFRRRSTNFIALVVPDIKNFFFAAVSHEIEEEAFRHGYILFTCNTSDVLEREATYFKLLSEEAVAGIVVCTASEHQAHIEVNRARRRGVAVVAIDRRLEDAPIDLVLSDNFGGARALTAHMIDRGHRRIAVISGSDDYAPARERRLGFEQALKDRGLPHDDSLTKITDFRDTGAEQATLDLLTSPNPPSAIFVCSGNQSIGTLRALSALGLRIPDDVSLAIFDDPEWARGFHPPLTTVEQNCAQIGGTAVAMLLRRIKDPDAVHEERRIPTRMHMRDSIKDLSGDGPAGPSTRLRSTATTGTSAVP